MSYVVFPSLRRGVITFAFNCRGLLLILSYFSGTRAVLIFYFILGMLGVGTVTFDSKM